MPIEIKELHIRVAVNAPENTGGQASPPSAPPTASSSAADQESLVAACVEQVLQILQDKRER